MRLTDQEHKMLKGNFGRGVAEAMKIVVALGEAFDAPRLVKVSRAHEAFGGGDSSTWFLELLASLGARCSVPTTCNPIFDDEYLEKIGRPLSKEDTDLCHRSRVARKKIGIIPTECCTPYLEGNVPRVGEIVAFSESSATPYVNSVCGARSHRESANSALASAICGKVPLYGCLLDENRKGDIRVRVDTALKDDFDYHLLGYAVGKEAGTRIPVFTGMEGLSPSPEELTSLGAELATSGAVSLYHIVGFTPEAKDLESAFGRKSPKRTLTVTDGDLQQVQRAHSQPKGKIDFVMFGCPHYSLWQVGDVARLLEGKKIRRGVDFWVFTSESTRDLARELGYEGMINKAGGHIIGRTCCDEICWERFYQGKVGATDSLKAAYYTSRIGIGFILERRSKCITAALKGGF
jgi:predicted aconitase